MRKQGQETALECIWDADQSRVLDGLAMGLSQNAVSRGTGIPVQTINHWVNDLSFSESFRSEIKARAALFEENRSAIEEQQITQATALVGTALAGEVRRDSAGALPVELHVALELLRATRWKQKAGEQHKQFGS